MRTRSSYFRTYFFHFSTSLLLPLAFAFASADNAAFISYPDAAPIFAALRGDLWPAEFRGRRPADIESVWPAWAANHDSVIRGRVAAGEEDSVVYFLLFGTSFTTAPRITPRELATLAVTPTASVASLRTRVDALVDAAAGRRTDERLDLVREVLTRAGIDLTNPTGTMQAARYLEARARALGGAGLQRAASVTEAAGGAATIFRDRGLSSDTTISTNLGIERALADLQAGGLLPRGGVQRVAIVGPGLDFVDKQFGYDFYPPQTIQPFAVLDSLMRTGLAASTVGVTTFDVSPRVNAHIAAARERARAGMPYTIVLPRDSDQTWSPDLTEYWKILGRTVGEEGSAAGPPGNAGRVQVRSVMIAPARVLQVLPRDLDLVLQRMETVGDAERFDLVIATNVLLYYDVFEQSLALANLASMMRKGGVLLSNTRVVELPGVPISLAGQTDVVYTRLPGIGDAGDRVFRYIRQ